VGYLQKGVVCAAIDRLSVTGFIRVLVVFVVRAATLG
jgi:hypothetical protein